MVAGPRLSLWRAPTDNDRIGGFARRWAELGLDRLERRLAGIEQQDGTVVVTADVVTGAGHVVRHVQTLTPIEGGVLVEERAVLPSELDDVPRVGSVLEVEGGERAGVVHLFGGAGSESYPDRRAASFARHELADLDRLFTPYIKPQESGGRNGVRWFALGGYDQGAPATARSPGAGPRRPSRRAAAGEPHPYRAQDLAAATHNDELVPREEVMVHIDAAHRGLGTASCGPDTLADYVLHPGEYRWSYTLVTPTA